MTNAVTIVMYHYVRQIAGSKYPEIKGLETRLFDEQMRYFKKYYQVITPEMFFAGLEKPSSLPEHALLLTFDDGYTDHYSDVFPILQREKLSGCFFPPAKCVVERKMLDVNKIHFVLASVQDKQRIVEMIKLSIKQLRAEFNLSSPEEYWKEYAIEDHYDPAEVIFIKRVLQKGLPLAARQRIIDELFARFVSADEQDFADGLYMSTEQLKTMMDAGMYVGSHGYDHFWLNQLSTEEQTKEVDMSLNFLKSIGSSTEKWIMCYPYGAYNDSLVSILKSRKCRAGLTTVPKVARFEQHSRFELPRLDTNDFPKNANAPEKLFDIATC